VTGRSSPGADDPHTTAPRAGLAAVALVAAAGWVLMRADAAGGYGPLAVLLLSVVWIAVWTLAALGAGRPVVQYLAAGVDSGWEELVISAIAGTGVLTASAWVLSLVGWFRPWPLMVVLLLWAIAGIVDLIRRPIAVPKVDPRLLPLAALGVVALLVAATLSPFYDQWHQHLGFPWVWLQDGSVHTVSRDWYSYMPVNSSLLFAYGLKTLGPWSAQVVHWWCGLVTVMAIWSLAKRVGTPGAGMWAAWIFVTTPTVLHLSTTAGTDLVVTIFAGGAWLALLRTIDRGGRRNRWWVFSGVCVGLAVGTKYIALGTVALPVAVGAVALHRPWRGADALRSSIRGAGLAFASAVVTFAPWAVRNFSETGNPLFPFVNGPFRKLLKVPAESVEEFSSVLSGLDLSFHHVIAGLDLGTFQASIDGFPSIGFAYLPLVAVAVLSWRHLNNAGWRALWVGAAAGVGFWLVTLHVSRYIVPVLVPAAPVLAVAFAATLRQVSGRLRVPLVALVGLIFVVNIASSVSSLGLERMGCTLGVAEVEPILARWVSSSPAFEPVSELPEDAKVLLVGEARALGFERPVEFEHPYRVSRLQELARAASDHRDIAARLTSEGVTHVLVNRWEVDRIIRLLNRKSYFEWSDPAAAERLGRFSRECLTPVWSGSGLGLFRIVPDCTASPPGAEGLAAW